MVTPCGFGKNYIIFRPNRRFFTSWRPHKVLEERLGAHHEGRRPHIARRCGRRRERRARSRPHAPTPRRSSTSWPWRQTSSSASPTHSAHTIRCCTNSRPTPEIQPRGERGCGWRLRSGAILTSRLVTRRCPMLAKEESLRRQSSCPEAHRGCHGRWTPSRRQRQGRRGRPCRD